LDSTFNRKSGNIQNLTSKTLPALKGLSAQRLILETNGIREPHLHTNANKLIYCLVSFQILIYLNLQRQDVFFL
jgi:hypothetical protein